MKLNYNSPDNSMNKITHGININCQAYKANFNLCLSLTRKSFHGFAKSDLLFTIFCKIEYILSLLTDIEIKKVFYFL